MVVIAKVPTVGMTCNIDIVRHIMRTSEFFKDLSVADAVAAYRYAEKNGLVHHEQDSITVFHDAN